LTLSAGLAHLLRRDLIWPDPPFGTSFSFWSHRLLLAAYRTLATLNVAEAGSTVAVVDSMDVEVASEVFLGAASREAASAESAPLIGARIEA